MKNILPFLFAIIFFSCKQEVPDPTIIKGKVVYEDTGQTAVGVKVKLMSNTYTGFMSPSLRESKDSILLDSSGEFYFQEQYINGSYYDIGVRYVVPSDLAYPPQTRDCSPPCTQLQSGKKYNLLIKISRDTLFLFGE